MQREISEPFLKDDQTLLIGLGASKSATTWLYSYFRNHPDCFAPAVKELDFFADSSISKDLYKIRRRLGNAKVAIEQSVKEFANINFDNMSLDEFSKFEALNAKIHDQANSAASLTVHGSYAANFARRGEETKVCVDISPSYCTDGLGNLNAMKSAHSQTRFFLSMRDPAERCFSAFKYGFKQGKKTIDEDPQNRFDQFVTYINEKNSDERTAYDVMLKACDDSISPENIFLCFYENIFNDETIRALCEFLDIEFVAGSYDQYVHRTDVAGKEVKMLDNEREFLVDRYKHVYKYIDERFGASAPDEWNWPNEIKTKRDSRANAG